MAGILEYSTTAASNTSINSIGVAGTNAISNIDNAFRQAMADSAGAITRHVTKAVGSYTPAKTDHNQFWRATGAVTLNLTAAATLTDGWCLWVKGDGGAITVDPNGGETINGAATLTIPDGTGAFIICNASTFYAITFGDVTLAGSQVLTNKTLTSPVLTTPQINDTSADHQYIFAVSELAGDCTVTLPLLAASDEFVFKAHNIQAQATWEAGVGTTESLITPAKLAAAITALATTPDYGAGNAALSYGAVGTYVFAYRNDATDVVAGDTYAGSSLSPTGVTATGAGAGQAYTGGAALSGTWRAMGAATVTEHASLYLRTV